MGGASPAGAPEGGVAEDGVPESQGVLIAANGLDSGIMIRAWCRLRGRVTQLGGEVGGESSATVHDAI